jgi:small-conductance mechanosensitive channel
VAAPNDLLDHAPSPLRDALTVERLGQALGLWLLALAVLGLSLVALLLLRGAIASRLRRLAERTSNDVDDLLAQLVQRTSRLFLLLVSVRLAAMPLELPAGYDRGLQRVFAVALFVQAGIWANHGVRWLIARYLRRRGGEASEIPRAAVLSLFGFFGQVVVWSVVTLLALANLGVDVTAAVAGLGIGGIAIGLALQNVLSDTFSSLAIILDKPFEEGDFVAVGDYLGTVERIGIKTTHLRSLSGEQIVLGNSDLLSSRIRNYKRMNERRALFSFGVLYETPLETVERIPGMVREIVESVEQTRFDRAHFRTLGASSLDFEVVYYVLRPDYNLAMDIQQRINLELMRRLQAEGVEFAYPTRTLYVKGTEAAAEEVTAPRGGPSR